MISLLEACEPIFQYISFLNRTSKVNQNFSLKKVYANVQEIFIKIKKELNTDEKLWRQFSRIELPLLFFVDDMIVHSNLSLAEEWDYNRISFSKNELVGDQKFFLILDEILNEFTIDSDECLKCFYTCLGLGFVGIYKDDPVTLDMYMRKILRRIPSLKNSELTANISNGPLNKIDDRNLIKLVWITGKKVWVLLVLMLIIWVGCNFLSFFLVTYNMNHYLSTIITH